MKKIVALVICLLFFAYSENSPSQELQNLISAEDSTHRAAAVYHLGQGKDFSVLIPFFEDPDFQVRMEALAALPSFSEVEWYPIWTKVLAGDDADAKKKALNVVKLMDPQQVSCKKLIASIVPLSSDPALRYRCESAAGHLLAGVKESELLQLYQSILSTNNQNHLEFILELVDKKPTVEVLELFQDIIISATTTDQEKILFCKITKKIGKKAKRIAPTLVSLLSNSKVSRFAAKGLAETGINERDFTSVWEHVKSSSQNPSEYLCRALATNPTKVIAELLPHLKLSSSRLHLASLMVFSFVDLANLPELAPYFTKAWDKKSTRKYAGQALRKLGKVGFEALEKLAESDERNLLMAEIIGDGIAKPNFIRQCLEAGLKKRRRFYLDCLGKMKTTAYPVFAEYLRKDNRKAAAVIFQVLRKHSEADKRWFLFGLTANNIFLQLHSLQILRGDPEVERGFVLNVNHQDHRIRAKTGFVLGEIFSRPESVLPIRKLLEDKNWFVVQQTLEGLAKSKMRARVFLPQVVTLLVKHSHWRVRKESATLLKSIGYQGDDVESALYQGLQDKHWHVRYQSLVSYCSLFSREAEEKKVFDQFLFETFERNRRSEKEQALAILQKVYRYDMYPKLWDHEIYRRSLTSLAANKKANRIILFLYQSLASELQQDYPNEKRIKSVSQALRATKEACIPLILLQVSRSEFELSQRHLGILCDLFDVVAHRVNILEVVNPYLTSENGQVRELALSGVNSYNAESKNIQKILFRALSDPVTTIVNRALSKITFCKQIDGKFASEIQALLQNESSIIRQRGLSAICLLEDNYQHLAYDVILALEDEDYSVRRQALFTLSKRFSDHSTVKGLWYSLLQTSRLKLPARIVVEALLENKSGCSHLLELAPQLPKDFAEKFSYQISQAQAKLYPEKNSPTNAENSPETITDRNSRLLGLFRSQENIPVSEILPLLESDDYHSNAGVLLFYQGERLLGRYLAKDDIHASRKIHLLQMGKSPEQAEEFAYSISRVYNTTKELDKWHNWHRVSQKDLAILSLSAEKSHLKLAAIVFAQQGSADQAKLNARKVDEATLSQVNQILENR